MKKEKAIVHKFKISNGKTNKIEKLKNRLSKLGFTEEEITAFENQANA